MEIVLLVLYVLIVLLMERHLWFKAQGSISRKLKWSVLLLLPLVGWFAYGANYSPAEKERGAAGSGKTASGWAPHWKDL